MARARNQARANARRLHTRLRRVEARIKALYALRDRLEAALIGVAPDGGFELADGRRAVVRDNFAGSNVAYRAAAVRRFEVVDTGRERSDGNDRNGRGAAGLGRPARRHAGGGAGG